MRKSPAGGLEGADFRRDCLLQRSVIVPLCVLKLKHKAARESGMLALAELVDCGRKQIVGALLVTQQALD